MSARRVRIIGIDPGLGHTGWGIVECAGSLLGFVAAGTIATRRADELSRRLLEIFTGLENALRSHRPDEAAVEATFVSRDGAATLKLGQARGVALLAPASYGLMVAEYAPNAIKKTVTGAGHGGKRQVEMMVRMLLPAARCDSEHAADALAVAICHAHQRGARALESRIARSA
jgi:crossover junction endodeoxyribonuclease RuvC